jgi:hypothetical protein
MPAALTMAMSPAARTAVQVVGALLLVAAVLWWMWRLPRRGEAGDDPPAWAAWLALLSPWSGLAALVAAAGMWLTAWADLLLTLTLLLLSPLAVGAGVLVLWAHRGAAGMDDHVQVRAMQRLQARVGLALGLAAVAAVYAFVLTHLTPFTVLEG